MTKKYTSSLTNARWQVIEKKLPEQMVLRKRDYPLRSIFDAIFYVLKNSSVWRDVPGDLPPSGITYYYFKTWRDNGLLEFVCQELGGDYRELMGRNRSPLVPVPAGPKSIQ